MSKIIIFLWMLIFSVLSYAAQEEDSGISFKILGVTACSKNGDTFMLAKAIITNNRKEKYRLMIRQDDILNYEWVAGFNVLTDIYIDDKPVYGSFGGVYNYSDEYIMLNSGESKLFVLYMGIFSDKGRKLNNIRISGSIMIDKNIEFPVRMEIETLDVHAC